MTLIAKIAKFGKLVRAIKINNKVCSSAANPGPDTEHLQHAHTWF